jgi:cellobiose phosphorylase
MNPVIPATWEGFSLRYRHGETIYAIQVENPTVASAASPGWRWMASA